jgi:putative ABC transport system ATP-binding protein
MVTHDPRIAAYADRIIFLKDGAIADETILEPKNGQNAEVVAGKMLEIRD